MPKPNTTASPLRSNRGIFAAGTLALLLASPALAQRAVDGDTLHIGAASVRLFGIDAPEMAQPCDDGGWHPGPIAARELAALMAGRHVECTAEGRDRYGRTVATCTADGADIGAAMVAKGWAWAFTKYSARYVELQHQAEAARLGVHAHACELPADYRAAKRAASVRLH